MRETATDELRTSRARRKAAGVLNSLTENTYKYAPWLRPDMISYGGSFLVAFGGVLSYLNQQNEDTSNALPALIMMSVGHLADGVDGAYARKLRSLGVDLDPMHGQLVDVFNDRIQEVFLAQIRAIMAHKRGDTIGARAALFNEATATLPSIARAYAESQGISVPEDGRSWVHLAGSRGGRVVLGTIATVFPEVRGFPLQTSLDVFMGMANIINTIDRVQAVRHIQTTQKISLEKIEEAQIRLPTLMGFALAAAVAAGYTNQIVTK